VYAGVLNVRGERSKSGLVYGAVRPDWYQGWHQRVGVGDGTEIPRLVTFVDLANDVLANPWAERSAPVTMQFVAVDDQRRGDWAVSGPTEAELKPLVLDLRIVMQPRSDLFLPKVLEAYDASVLNAELHEVSNRVLNFFTLTRDKGMTILNKRPVQPWRVAELWFYGRYHHRNLYQPQTQRA